MGIVPPGSSRYHRQVCVNLPLMTVPWLLPACYNLAMLRVSILGSCVTGDPVYQASGEIQMLSYQARTSFISQNSPPLELAVDALSWPSRFAKQCVLADFQKSALQSLEQGEPEAIVFDLIDDRFDLLRCGDSYVLLSDPLREAGFQGSLSAQFERIARLSPEASGLWLRACDSMAKKLAEMFPRMHLILHRCWFASEYQDGATVRSFDSPNLKKSAAMNEMLAHYYAHFERALPRLTSIEVDLPRRADAHHKYGLTPFHYGPTTASNWSGRLCLSPSPACQGVDPARARRKRLEDALYFRNSRNKMRILVTGGAGFIGSHLAERLLQDGHQVVVLDVLDDYYSPVLKLENLEQVRKSGPLEFVQGDICDEEMVTEVLATRRIEAIAHLAALAGVTASLERPVEYQKVNVRGTIVLLEAARRCGVEKFVFASSSSVYGQTSHLPFSEDNRELLPISPYGATKIAGERMGYVYAHLYRLPVVCLRLFTVYGPRQRPDLALCKFASLIDAGEEIPVYGDGSTTRDYTYCGDIVAGFAAALGYRTEYDIFNLGSSRRVALRDAIAALEDVLERRAKIRWLPERPGDLPTTFADVSKAERLLGYQPRTSLRDGLRQLVEWQRVRRLAKV
jgi:UDP-glucuronate 4-epimerase